MPWVEMMDNDPGGPDFFIRSAIHHCWTALPKTSKNVDEVERQFRRLADRALRDFRADAEIFLQSLEEDDDETA